VSERTPSTSSPSSKDRAAVFPVMERPTSALVLAFTSGVLNAWTFANVGTFATVQSGNLVTLGFFGAQGDWSRASAALTTLLAFGLGAALCAVAVAFVLHRGRAYSPWVLLFEALTLAVCSLLAATGAAPAMAVALVVAFVAGIQGNAFHRDHGMLYGNTAMTFVVQSAFSFLGRAVVGRRLGDGEPHLRVAGTYGLVVVAFAAGGAAGFALGSAWPAAPLLTAALAVLVLGLVTGATRGPVDPAQSSAPTP